MAINSIYGYAHVLICELFSTILNNETVVDFYGIKSGNPVSADAFMSDDREFTLYGLASLKKDALWSRTIDSGSSFVFTEDDVVSYSINEQNSNGFEMGSTVSAEYTLVINKETIAAYDIEQIIGSAFAVIIGNNGYFWPMGVWEVSDVDWPELGATVTLKGYDILGSRKANERKAFRDEANNLLPAITFSVIFSNLFGTVAHRIGYNNDAWDIGTTWSAPVANDIKGSNRQQITSGVEAGPGTTFNVELNDKMYSRRDCVSKYAASCAYFAHVDRAGIIRITPYDWNRYYDMADGEYRQYRLAITPQQYYNFSYTPNALFSFNRLQAAYVKDTGTMEYDIYENAIDSTIDAGKYNTLQIDENPLLNDTRAAEVFSGLQTEQGSTRYFESEFGSVSFCGTPTMEFGDRVKITDVSGIDHYILVNSCETKYDGGLSMTIACEMPNEFEEEDEQFADPESSLINTGVTGGVAYTTSEVYTGRRWLDKKPIYRYIVKKTGVTQYNGTAVSLGFLPSLPDTVVDVRGMTVTPSANPNYWRPIPFAHSTTGLVAGVWVQNDNGDVRAVFGSASTWNASKTVIAIVEYTKA